MQRDKRVYKQGVKDEGVEDHGMKMFFFYSKETFKMIYAF